MRRPKCPAKSIVRPERNSKNGDDSGESRDQQQYRRGDFAEPCHITKPLANAEGSERFNHLFIARQLGKPC